MGWSRRFFRILLPLCILGLVLRLFFIQSLVIQTDRLEPHLKRGDLVIGMKGQSPARGDFVAYDCIHRRMCIGRILGQAGDRLDFSGPNVVINRTTQKELVLSDASQLKSEALVVNPDTYFLEGDELGEVSVAQIRSVLSRILISVDPEKGSWRSHRTLMAIH